MKLHQGLPRRQALPTKIFKTCFSIKNAIGALALAILCLQASPLYISVDYIQLRAV
jgi:hypothetical protein